MFVLLSYPVNSWGRTRGLTRTMLSPHLRLSSSSGLRESPLSVDLTVSCEHSLDGLPCNRLCYFSDFALQLSPQTSVTAATSLALTRILTPQTERVPTTPLQPSSFLRLTPLSAGFSLCALHRAPWAPKGLTLVSSLCGQFPCQHTALQ